MLFSSRRGALLLSLLVGAGVVSGGCRAPRNLGVAKPPRQAVEQPKRSGPDASVIIPKADFNLDDDQGRPLIRAKVTGAIGGLGGPANAGPVSLKQTSATLYKNGKPELKIDAPEALWQDEKLVAEKGAHVETVDGSVKADAKRAVWEKQILTSYDTDATFFQKGQPKMKFKAPETHWVEDTLVANRTAHAETPDGKTQLDAQRAVWTRKTAKLVLSQAVGKEFENGKQTVQAEGPKVEYADNWLVLPATGMARRLDDGSSVRADKIRWNRQSAEMDASGHVHLDTPTVRATGPRLVGNTNLKKGRMTGRPHMTFLKSSPTRIAGSLTP